MLTEADRKLLVEAQGKKWECPHCGDPDCKIRPTFTDPSELGPLLLWAKEQEWWDIFINHTYDLWWECEHDLTWDKYMSWLFRSTEHFAKLLIEFGKERLGWGKEKSNA